MAAFDLLIRGGHVYGPEDWGVVDIGVRAGRVAAIGRLAPGRAGRTVEARGLVIIPGLIDPHTHISLPLADGTSTCDDFFTGTVAALRGGITTVIDFAEPGPGESPASALSARLAQARGRAVVDYLFTVTLASARADDLAEVPRLVKGGIRSFKLYTVYAGMALDDRSLLACLETIARAGALATVHAESAALTESLTERLLEAGHREAVWLPRARPPEAEAEAVWRVTVLASVAGAALCIRHLSSAAGLQAALGAPRTGPVWVESAPQYLSLDAALYAREDGHRFIAIPPLRSPADREALWRAVAGGQVHFLGTDHCALSASQKDRARDFSRVPGGLPGLETFLPLVYTLGVGEGRIDLPRLVQVLSTAAARAFGLYPRKGTLLPGADADLVLLDPGQIRPVSVGEGLAACLGWSPYAGWELRGWPRMVISRGEVVFAEGEFLGQPGRGIYLAEGGVSGDGDVGQ